MNIAAIVYREGYFSSRQLIINRGFCFHLVFTAPDMCRFSCGCMIGPFHSRSFIIRFSIMVVEVSWYIVFAGFAHVKVWWTCY